MSVDNSVNKHFLYFSCHICIKSHGSRASVGQVMCWFVLIGEMHYYSALCCQHS